MKTSTQAVAEAILEGISAVYTLESEASKTAEMINLLNEFAQALERSGNRNCSQLLATIANDMADHD